MRVNIRSSSSAITIPPFEVVVESDADVNRLKSLISVATGIEENSQRLIFSGSELENSKQLTEYEISDNSLVRLVVTHTIHYTQQDRADLQHIPNVTDLLPNKGPSTGGHKVRILGEHFPEFSTFLAKFGETVTQTTYKNENELECYAPAHSPGSVAVEISHDGIHFTNNGIIYTYIIASLWENTSGIAIPVCSPNQVRVQDNCRPLSSIPNYNLNN